MPCILGLMEDRAAIDESGLHTEMVNTLNDISTSGRGKSRLEAVVQLGTRYGLHVTLLLCFVGPDVGNAQRTATMNGCCVNVVY